MRRRFRNVAALAVVSLVGLGSAACDLTETGAEPGVVASIGDQRLELDKVDDAVADYCTLRAKNPEASADPTALIRTQFVVVWTQAIAVEHLAAEYDVALPPTKVDPAEVESAWGALGTIDDDNFGTFEWLTWLNQRVGDPLVAIGAAVVSEESEGQVSEEQAYARGLEVVDAWLEDHPPHLNPTFGTFDIDYQAQTVSQTGDTLSIPVSGPARDTQDTGKLDAQAVAALPPAQRCGPAPKPGAQVPGA